MYVPSKAELGAASATKRPTSCVLITETEKGSKFEHPSGTGDILEAIDGVIDKVCDFESPEGSWMAETDIVKEGSELKLVQNRKPCGR